MINLINVNYWFISVPIVFLFGTPILYVSILYIATFILHLYRIRYRLPIIFDKQQIINFDQHWKHWNDPVTVVSKFFTIIGRVWHDHEIINMNHIPDDGGAIIVFYHSTLPNDFHYLIAKIFLDKHRLMYTITDHSLYYVPGWSLLLKVFQLIPGTRNDCIQLLKQKHLLALSPGGLREAMFGDHNYQLVWAGRQGFAHVAREAQVPIIPVFTQNSREAFRSLPLPFRNFFRKIYDRFKIPMFIPYGGLPVKLTTIIGEPIHFPPEMSASEIADLTAKKMEQLIDRYQTRPGSILKALWQRFCSFK
ncbi:DGAT1/2-independent enzyme synthesizing storage lipids [Dermatophagoides farinae]|uniref:DGAT1/2-independent enzyme synthesizing storage lipids n=1 Tax=Dermatophagoides farinae TaxID=6954 RepID=UPI003F601D02